MYSLVAPCRLPDLTSLALVGSVSGQHGLSRGLLPGYKMVSKWRLHSRECVLVYASGGHVFVSVMWCLVCECPRV